MSQPPSTSYSVSPKNNPLALTALVLGIVAFPLTCIPYINFICWIAAIAAIVLGFIARGQIKQGMGTGSGMATAGIILGSVYLVLVVIMVILALAFGMTFLHFARQAAEQQHQRNSSTSPSELFRHAFHSAFTLGRAWLGR